MTYDCRSVSQDASLGALAAAIRAGIDEIYNCERRAGNEIRNALRIRMDVGDRLNWALAKVPYGQRGRWLKENCGLKPRTEELFRYLAEHRSAIEHELERNPGLTLRGAIRLIAKSTSSESSRSSKSTLPSGATFNRADLKDRQAFLADIDLDKFSEALPLHKRAELQRRADYRGKPQPGDDFTNKLGKALKMALSSAAMKTPEGKTNVIAAINGINNLLRAAGLDLHDVEIAINAKDARRAA